MSDSPEWVILPLTENRDPNEVLDSLKERGIDAELVLQLPADQAEAAEEILANLGDTANPSHELDLETIARVPEMEAAAIRGLLEANGITVIVEEAVVLPSLPIEINVPKKDAEIARQLLEDVRKESEASLEAESEL